MRQGWGLVGKSVYSLRVLGQAQAATELEEGSKSPI